MTTSREQLQRIARDAGFDPRYLEKVQRLLECLKMIEDHEDLQGQFVLKGGTALNLFHFEAPRLSVDLDLNYIGETDVERMKDVKPSILQAMEGIFQRLGFTISNEPDYEEHAGITWKMTYGSNLGGRDNIKIDLNFLMRVPLFPIQELGMKGLQTLSDIRFNVQDVHELAGGKLRALFERSASRDLFDCYQLLYDTSLEKRRLRLAFVVYGAISRVDWRTISIGDIEYQLEEAKDQLFDLLREKEHSNLDNLESWISNLAEKCRERMEEFLPFTDNEIEFLTGVNERGEIQPSLLTDNPKQQERIRKNPGLRWKIKNVREHYDLPEDDER